jgi:peptide chain release factor 2
MEDLKKRIITLNNSVLSDAKSLNIKELRQEQQKLLVLQSQPDFWADNAKATTVNKKIANLAGRVEPWHKLIDETNFLVELAAEADESLLSDITNQFAEANHKYQLLKKDLLFKGPFDDHNAVINLYAGAGGTDAQDWTAMLLRMYLRFIDKAGDFSAEVIEESSGEEAGLKSATLIIGGPMAYGKLKGENGVHRLVRLSPFNADNLRQTSFAKVEVLPKIDAPKEVELDEKDLKIDVYRAGGHGGQSVNTTDSAVRVTHMPTGITVAIQNERSQLQNKETALTILRSKLASLQMEQHVSSIKELKGPNEQASWGNQIRNYVLHPYNLVKDSRSKYETANVQEVLEGNLDPLIDAYLENSALAQ